jgi:hypothetical protein
VSVLKWVSFPGGLSEIGNGQHCGLSLEHPNQGQRIPALAIDVNVGTEQELVVGATPIKAVVWLGNVVIACGCGLTCKPGAVYSGGGGGVQMAANLKLLQDY